MEVERLVGRYDLVEEVISGSGRALWRGHDVVLDRPVGVLVLDKNHPRAGGVRAAAQAAARIEHPSILRVVDADTDNGRVLVVTRWLQGSTVAELLTAGPLVPEEAVDIARQVASALAASAREGVHHLVLDPRDVLISDHGVAVLGVGVRAALQGVEAGADAEQVDAWRVGALLYAALTARWPGGPCAGLEEAPLVADRVASPRQVRAGVPTDVDEVVQRTVQPDAETPLRTPAAVAEALASVGEPPRWTAPTPSRPVPWRTLGIVAIGLLFLTGVLLVGWAFWQDLARDAPGATATPTAAPSGVVSTPATEAPEEPVPIAAARAFDPAGDNQENDEDAALAIDGDPATAWRTVTYATRDLGNLKPGVGLQLRLGGTQSVGGIELELVGRGTDLQIWAKRPRGGGQGNPDSPLVGYKKLASVPGAGDQVTLRFAPSVETRSVVIWLTALPASDSGYRGGIAEVVLLT